MPLILTITRYVVLGVVLLAAIAAFGSWLVRTRRVSPFSRLGRGVRSMTDAVLMPLERRLVRLGGNPAHAGGWLIILTAIVGIVFLSLVGWLVTTFLRVQTAAHGGSAAIFVILIELGYRILLYALVVRVIAGWFGLFRYSRWIRPAYILTDWIVEPIRRVVPPLGAFDVSPIIAWVALWALRQILLGIV